MSLPNGMKWERQHDDSAGRWITTGGQQGKRYSYDTIPRPGPRFLIMEYVPVIGEAPAYVHISVAGQSQAEAIITAIETARDEGGPMTRHQDHPEERSGEIPVLHMGKFEKKIKRVQRALRELNHRLTTLEMLYGLDYSDKAPQPEEAPAEGYVFVPEPPHVCKPPVGDLRYVPVKGRPHNLAVLADGSQALQGTIWRCACGVEWTVNDLLGWERLTPIYE